MIKVGSSTREIAAQIRRRQRPRFFGLLPEQAALLGQFFPDVPYLIIQQADEILEHRFDILGSGKTELGKRIDWHTDFKHNHTWPLIHHTRLKLTSPKGGFDVKVPWELSRFHHALRLGQAYLFTLDERYAQEIIDQVSDWIKSNPLEFGINWAGPMDVAIRAINWVWAYYMILESESLTERFLALWLTSFRQHGEYLIKHLEDGWPRTNHLIADLAGLAYLGIMFPEFSEAVQWRSTGLGRLWAEIDRQIYPDGMDYEASIPYHRLVTEMALSVAALCVINNIKLPETTHARLRSMLNVIMTYTQPDGTAPQIGDADDGRLLPLTVHAESARAIQDHRHLLALGSLVLERETQEWAGYVPPTRQGWSIAAESEWQDAFWYFTSDAAARLTDVLISITKRPERVGPDDWVDLYGGIRVRARVLSHRPFSLDDVISSGGFEAGGLYVMRREDFHLTINTGGPGQDGLGGHAHNDALSITLAAYGKTFLIDPGSFVYTSSPDLRNSFRSTSYHNTLQVGESEINRIPDGDLFRLTADATTTVHRWVSQPAYDLFEASHDGYARLKPGIVHRRRIWFDKLARLWILNDRLDLASSPVNGNQGSSQKQPVTLSFHFAPMPVRFVEEHNAIRTDNPNGVNLILMPLRPFPLKAVREEGWYSPRYGIREQAPVAKFVGRVKLPVDLVVLLYPHQTTADFKVVEAAGQAALLNFKRALSPSNRLSSLKASK